MDDPNEWQLGIELTQPRRTALLYLALNLPGSSAEQKVCEPGPALQNAVLAALTCAVPSAATVSQLDTGTFACLLRRAPSRETLSLCSWILLDEVSTLVRNSKNASSLRVAIGVSTQLMQGARYATLLRNADAAMHRARRQRSGYAFFDQRVDVWELAVSETEASGV